MTAFFTRTFTEQEQEVLTRILLAARSVVTDEDREVIDAIIRDGWNHTAVKTPMQKLAKDIAVKAVSKGDAWHWVIEKMPDEASAALLKFTGMNSSYRGAHWEDCLEVLLDCDAHLDITEPMADDMPEWGALPAAVTMTLIYASRLFATDMTTNQRIQAVRSTINNNTGGL